MNYFIGVHSFIVFLLEMALIALGVILTVFLWVKVSKLAKFSRVGSVGFGAFVFVMLFVSILGVGRLVDTLFHGYLNQIFIVRANGKTYLTAHTIIRHRHRVGSDYVHRLESFDLESGMQLGRLFLGKVDVDDTYRFYWAGGKKAWGFSRKTGLMLLDLTQLAVLATEADIIQRNADLALDEKLRLARDGFNPRTQEISIYSGGRLYSLNHDLKARPLPRPVFFSDLSSLQWQFKTRWALVPVKNAMGRRLHRKNTPFSDNAAKLLQAKFLPELNLRAPEKLRLWVEHQTTLYRNAQPLLSYIDAEGKEIKRIHLSKRFSGKPGRALGTYSEAGRMFVFVGVGQIKRDFLVYSLSALKVNPRTGEILEVITYF